MTHFTNYVLFIYVNRKNLTTIIWENPHDKW